MPFRAVITSKERVQAAKAASSFVVPPDDVMLEYCQKATKKTKAAMSFVTFVFEETHHVVAAWGFTDAALIVGPGESPGTWTASVCAFVVASGSPMTFHDTQESALLEDCLAIEKVRSYSGAPICFRDQVVGAFGVCDLYPRTVSQRQLRALIKLAGQVGNELEKRDV